MHEQIGWRGLWRNIKHEAPLWTAMLPTLPRKLNDLLAHDPAGLLQQGYHGLVWEQRKRNYILGVIAALLAGILTAVVLR